MSSQPTSTMAPVRRRRSLAGPIVLILIGVLFLLGNLGYLGWRTIGLLWAHYWPVLLILWGVIKLVEHYSAQRGGYPARGIGAGGVFLLIFLVICGLAATEAARVNWKQVGKEIGADNGDFAIFGPFGNSYDFSDELQQDFPAGGSLRAVCDRGDITVLPWDENRIKVTVHKRVVADSESNARQVNDSTKPNITVAGSTLTVNGNTSAAGDRRVTTDLEIFVPRKAALDASTGHGNLVVRDRKADVRLSTSHADVEANGIQGNLSINLRKGNVRLDNIQGNVDFSGVVDDLSASNVSGALKLSGEFFGTMNLSHIEKGVQFNSSRTDLQLARLDGDLAMESGELHARALTGPTRIVTRAKDIRLDEVSGDIQVQDSNGDVELRQTKLPLGNISVDNRKGGIRLVVPANAAFQVNGRTYRGDISSDFHELKITSGDPENRVSGTVGDGGPAVRLNTEHADIEIRKG